MNQETPSTHPNRVIKYCPFCGAKELESRDVNYFYCNSCQKEYFTNTAAAVAAIITDNQGRILFTRRAKDPFKGMLDLPGGFVDAGETAEDALYREIREELGKEIIEFSYFCSFPNEYPYSGLTYYTLDLAFLCKLESMNNLKAMDDVTSIEFINPMEVSLDEIGSLSMRNIIRTYRGHLL